MHLWGGEGVDWAGIGDAAWYIGSWLRRWTRMHVSDMKEKYGTTRVYCSFGWSTFYQVFYPGYMWVKPWWPYKLDLWLSYQTPIMKWLNCMVIPVQKWAYVYRYNQAVRKWPHLYEEILLGADWGELFVGKVPGYEHRKYWITIGDDNED